MNIDRGPIRVLQVVNSASPESIPLELAFRMPEAGVRTAVAPYYVQEPGAPAVPDSVEWFPLDAEGWLSASAVRRLRSAVKQFQPHVVHVHHFPSALVATSALGPGSAHFVKTEHNDHRRQPLHQNLAVLPVLARAGRVVCNSRTTRRSFYPWETALAGRRAVHIHNGVDVARVRAARPVAVPFETGATVVSVGRLVRQKNFPRLIEALRIARGFGADINLLIVGGGRQAASLQDRIDGCGLSARVRVTGVVERDAVYGLLRSCDAAIVASLWEGFCNAAVEAMVAGLPLAASDLPVLREVLGDAPEYFDPTDPRAIARALVAVVDHPDPARTEAGSRRAAESLSLDVAVSRHADLYRQLVGSR